MKNIILKNGLLGGLIVSIVMTCMTLYMKSNPNNEPSAIIGFASMLLAFTFLFLGVKKVRETNEDKITFGKAFLTGLYIALIISTIYVLVWLVIYYNFFPNFMEQYSDLVLNKLKAEGNLEELAAKSEEMEMMKEWYKSPIMIVLLTLMEILPIGIVVSLISALILKKK
ncbi:DUF4199 domain-containing protein [Flavobacterium sp.]|jgi:hypothetical protein|uniref:DUF4199 domain-containing protein n=1 Tax=Flavobacterium sp. TaxID=239 RepID=UPI002A803FCC|nr:DUF4199 domain-containing protein [Flavobacterium sp.]